MVIATTCIPGRASSLHDGGRVHYRRDELDRYIATGAATTGR